MPGKAKKPDLKKPRPVARSRCAACKASGAETFWFLRRSFIFDVDRARELTQDGRKAKLLDRSDVRYVVDTRRINEAHVPHVEPRFPGIVARVRFTNKDGSIVRGDVLIDGHHRAARCLQLGRPFSVYLLTYDESDEVLKRRPDAARRRKAQSIRQVRRGSKAKARAVGKTR